MGFRIANCAKRCLRCLLVIVLINAATIAMAAPSLRSAEASLLSVGGVHPARQLWLAKEASTVPQKGVEKAMRLAKEHFGGKVLSATLAPRFDGQVYRVKMISEQGRVHNVFVDIDARRVFKR